jgi:hypothetical protein
MVGTASLWEGGCLPEDYWALTARAASVTFVDTLVQMALYQGLERLGFPVDELDDGGESDAGA